jgi:hypothetical protein
MRRILTSTAFITPQKIAKTALPMMKAGATFVSKNVVDVSEPTAPVVPVESGILYLGCVSCYLIIN